MTEEAILDAARFGAILGIGMGVCLVLVVREVIKEFQHWRRSLEHARQIRSMKDWK